jgi:CHAT domain-containing protein
VEAFRRLLERRTTNGFLEPAQRLHALIARPVEAVLAGRGVGTLVLVPDAVLRTIPFGALHDGERFWVERYAMATVPGLRLVDPRPLPAGAQARLTLVAGLSQGRQGFAALPNVSREVRAVGELSRGTSLVDGAFLRPRFSQELRQRDYSIVHIASHGEFAGDRDDSFLLTYDGRLDMNELERLIRLSRFRDEPVELLTLSACETAAGDDRSALGLAGVAVKVGARSALATLWEIADESTVTLTTGFYAGLVQPGVSRAEALRRAQLGLLADERYRHPFFWGPFLLIGSWV